MRAGAKRTGKAVPTIVQLDNMLSWTKGLICQDCGRKMNRVRKYVRGGR